MCGHPDDPDSTSGVFDTEERAEPAQGDGFKVEQVAGDDAFGLRFEELPSGRARPPRRRVQALRLEERPDCRRTDPIPETGEFAVDPPVPPVGVLDRQPLDQGTHTTRDRRTTYTAAS